MGTGKINKITKFSYHCSIKSARIPRKIIQHDKEIFLLNGVTHHHEPTRTGTGMSSKGVRKMVLRISKVGVAFC